MQMKNAGKAVKELVNMIVPGKIIQFKKEQVFT